jgi:hypothetical protein
LSALKRIVFFWCKQCALNAHALRREQAQLHPTSHNEDLYKNLLNQTITLIRLVFFHDFIWLFLFGINFAL